MNEAMDQQEDLSAVPLFPLPNVVLFPGAVLPLHVFEERYKTMTAHALRGPRRIAMALLRPGWEKNYHGRPAIEPVVCVGTIVSHEKLPDGRYNFLLRGDGRARIVREYGDEAYRVAWLNPLTPTPVLEIDLTEDRRRLEAVFDSRALRESGLGQQFLELMNGPIPTTQLADLIAFYFLEDVRLKQSVLAERDVRTRVARVAEAFESLHSVLQTACPASFCKNPGVN